MSTLGDYIHLNYKNYEKYGTSRRDLNSATDRLMYNYNAQVEKNKQRIKQIPEINKNTIEEIKKIIGNQSEQAKAMEMAKNLANLSKSLSKIEKDFRKAIIQNVSKYFNNNNNSNLSLGEKELKLNLKQFNIKEAKLYQKRMMSAINTANQNFNAGKPVQKITIDTILKCANLFFEKLGFINNSLDFFKIKDIKDKNMIAMLEAVSNAIKLEEVNISALHGIYGETLVHMADDKIRELSGKELENAIKESIKTGEIRGSFRMDESMIHPKVQKEYYKMTKNNLYQLKATQNKVDASITIGENKVEASIKAYQAKGNVMQVHSQDVNLITSLITTEEQFANHWISLQSYNKQNKRMNEELKKHFIYEALASGNLLKQNSSIADTFIAIDMTKGRVYIKSVKDILNNDIDKFGLSPNLEDISIKNNVYSDTWERRIAKILMELHQRKISVKYNIALL